MGDHVKAVIFVALSLWIVVIPFMVFIFPIITLVHKNRYVVNSKYFAGLFMDCYDICFSNNDIPSEYDFNIKPLIDAYSGYIIYTPLYTFYFYQLENEPDRLYWRINRDELHSGSNTFLNNRWYFFEHKNVYKYMVKYIKMINQYAKIVRKTVI